MKIVSQKFFSLKVLLYICYIKLNHMKQIAIILFCTCATLIILMVTGLLQKSVHFHGPLNEIALVFGLICVCVLSVFMFFKRK